MSCETVIGSIVALLDGELPDAERPAVEDHLAACAACQGELRELRRARAAITQRLRSLDPGVARTSFDALWARIEVEEPAAQGRSRTRVHRTGAARALGRLRPALWAGAGGVALAASLALVIAGLPRDGTEKATPTTPPRVASGPGAPEAAPAAVAGKETSSEERVAAAPRSAPAAKPEPARPQPADDDSLDAPTDEAAAVAVNEIDPPRDLLERPELFLNYPIVRKLDELQHLESVLADSPGGGRAG